MTGHSRRPLWVALAALAVSGAGAGLYLARGSFHDPSPPQASSSPAHEAREKPRVAVVHPTVGTLQRTSVGPGSVQAFESVDLFAGVPGYLKTLAVDIGDRVEQGQVLARVDVPELEVQVKRNVAGLDQARARVRVMAAKAATASAELDSVQAAVIQAEAAAKSAAASRRFREQQLKRMQDLFASNSIDERLVDEKTEQRDAALEAERAAQAAIATAHAQVNAAKAKIQQAEADVLEAQAEVQVAQADLEKSQVMVRFATLKAPFRGVVTHRSHFPADYVRPPAPGGTADPVLTVQRTDLMRVVFQMPDRDVPYADVGDPADIEIDAMPGQRFPAKISRKGSSEDPGTRLMRVELDLPNPDGKIAHGMYGKVTIVLDKVQGLSLPSSALVGKSQQGKAQVFVVRDGHASLTPVQIGSDDGIRVGVLSGLSASDEVVVRPSADLAEGAEVVGIPAPLPRDPASP